MLPVKSNLNKDNCSPVSSNCVIWQGPDLPCIALCTGDSISEVVYKVAVTLCDLQASLDLSDVDLTCLLDITSTLCPVIPEPEKTVAQVIQFLVDKVCCLSDIVDAITPTGPAEVQVAIANCFKPYVNAQGQTVSVLPVSEYAMAIGEKLCTVAATVATHTLQIQQLENDVAELMADPGYQPPTPVPVCILTPGVPQDLEIFVQELENQFCQLTETLGSNPNLVTAQGAQCLNLSSATPLSTGIGTMSTYDARWTITPSNFAQAMTNLWLTVCDIRAAVKTIQDNCCKISCEDIIVDFDVKRTLNDEGDFVLMLYFVPKTVMPSTWYDCDQTPNAYTEYGYTGNKLVITDSAGHTTNAYIQLRSQDLTVGILQDIPVLNSGYELNLQDTPIDQNLDINIVSDVCVTDGSTTCIKCINIDVPYINIGCCEIKNTSSTQFVTVVYSY
jgi:hypothetical protein